MFDLRWIWEVQIEVLSYCKSVSHKDANESVFLSDMSVFSEKGLKAISGVFLGQSIPPKTTQHENNQTDM